MGNYFIETNKKAREFIDSLDKIRRARVDRIYYLFEEYGVFLPNKYLKKIAKGVWKLRPQDIRIFLTIKGNKGYVVHGIYKKAQKIPKKDLDLAIKRVKEVEQ